MNGFFVEPKAPRRQSTGGLHMFDDGLDAKRAFADSVFRRSTQVRETTVGEIVRAPFTAK
jgi:hypothetical protein